MLDPETLYVIQDGDTVHWVRTPDGEGCYWYDEGDEDAYSDVCDFQRTRNFDTMAEWDDFRYPPE